MVDYTIINSVFNAMHLYNYLSASVVVHTVFMYFLWSLTRMRGRPSLSPSRRLCFTTCLPVFLFVCVSACYHLHIKTTDRIFMKIFTKKQ